MNILVTGANGFVGRYVTQRLRQEGHQVIACTRQGTGKGEIATGDLAIFDSWERLLQGVDIVIHLAARVHQTRAEAANDEHAFYQANVVVTQHLLDACERTGIQHFIYLSTIAVMGYDSGNDAFRSSSRAPYNPYSRSKAEAEMLVEASALNWSIIRIPLVYGAGVRANFLSLMKAVKHHLPLPLGLAHNRRSVLYVGNLADAIVHMLSNPAVYRQHLLIADKEVVSSKELVQAIARAMGKTPFLLPFPPVLLNMIPVGITYHKLFGNLEMDCSRTFEQMDWQPPFTLEEGLQDTVRWFMNQIAN